MADGDITTDGEQKTWISVENRAILDIGLLDISPDFLIPEDDKVEIVNASSDMLIVDLGEAPGDYKVGSLLSFRLKYMGALRLLNSDYIEKRVV